MLHGSSNKRMDEVAWGNKSRKEQISLKKEAEKAMRKVQATASFDEGSVSIGKEIYTE